MVLLKTSGVGDRKQGIELMFPCPCLSANHALLKRRLGWLLLLACALRQRSKEMVRKSEIRALHGAKPVQVGGYLLGLVA